MENSNSLLVPVIRYDQLRCLNKLRTTVELVGRKGYNGSVMYDIKQIGNKFMVTATENNLVEFQSLFDAK